MLSTFSAGITELSFTLQNKAIFFLESSGSDLSHLHNKISGCIPRPNTSLTECCVGFVLNSLELSRYGTSV